MSILIQETHEITVEDRDSSITIQTVPDISVTGNLTLNHSSLTNLDQNDHPQYRLKTDSVFTNAEVKTAYEANSDTNNFNNAYKQKLDGIANGATGNPTAATVKSLYLSNSDTNNFNDSYEAKLLALGKVTTLAVDTTLDLLVGVYFIDASSNNVTITLPTAVGNTQKIVNIKRVDNSTNIVTVATTSTETIDDYEYALISYNQNIQLVSNNTDWKIL